MAATTAAPPTPGPPAQPAQPPRKAPVTLGSTAVANQFVQQYYHVLSNWPENLHRFYTDASTLSHSVVGGETTVVQTQRGIHEKVLGLGLRGAVPQILSVDAQASLDGGVVVHTTGFLTVKGTTKPRPFAQVFFLAQQEIGYYVLNDLFCWQRDASPKVEAAPAAAAAQSPGGQSGKGAPAAEGGEAPGKPKPAPAPAASPPKEKAEPGQPQVQPQAPAAALALAAVPKEKRAEDTTNSNKGAWEGAPMTYAQRAAAAAKRVSVQVPQSKSGSEVLAARNWGGEEEEKKPTIIKKKRERGKGRGRRDRDRDRGNSKSNNN